MVKVNGLLPYRVLLLIFAIVSLSSCAGSASKVKDEIKRAYLETDKGISIPRQEEPEKKVYSPPPIPEFRPAQEDVVPLKARMVEIIVRTTPLRDVLYVIAQVCGLNLVFEKGVDTELPITVTLKNVTAEYALNSILASTDYSWTLKGQTLHIRAEETKFFELSFAPVIQTYGVDVGGDILGGVQGGGGSTGGGGGSSIKGSVTQGIKGDEAALNFWSSVEQALSNIVGPSQAGTSQVVVNRVAGTIQVTTSRKKMEVVEAYLERLKAIMNRQVIIEAKILEVGLNEGFTYGIDWSYVTGGLNLSTTGLSSAVPSSSPSTRLEGVKLFGTGTSLQSVVRAIEQQGEVRILSNPRLNVMNGQTALLTVGTNQSYLSKVETTTTAVGTTSTVNFTVETTSVLSGILIGIVPYVNEKGEIYLTITPIISDLVNLTQRSVGTQIEISLPTVELRELSTSVKARDGETIVLGGLMAQKEKMEDNQVPLLGRIPLLGMLFKSRDKLSKKTELVVLLQPRIVTR